MKKKPTSRELFSKFIERLSDNGKINIESYSISGGGTITYLFDIRAEDGQTVQFAFSESGSLDFIDTF